MKCEQGVVAGSESIGSERSSGLGDQSPKRSMKALVIESAGEARIDYVPEPEHESGKVLLRVRMVGLCGSDLNTFRGRNPMVSFPRIPGHEIAATIVE